MSLNPVRSLRAAGSAKLVWQFALLFFSVMLLGPSAFAQGALTNGYTHQATIAPVGNVDAWTFTATAGDRIVIRVGKISQTNTFTPRIALLNPSAVPLAVATGNSDAELFVTATNTGTFTVNVDDSDANATGTYRLTLAKSPGTITVAPGDEGGELTNGWRHTGTIEIGDLDQWSFAATSGDSIVLRMGCTNAFYPWIRLYGPNGVLLAAGNGTYDGEASFRATNSGTFTVVASSFYDSTGYSGNYTLSLAKSPGTITIAPGDEGGALTNGWKHTGRIDIGDLDEWSFTANSGDSLVVRMGSTNGIYPYVRLYGPDGRLLDADFAQYDGEAAFRATNSGTFTVVASAYYDSSGYSGNYILSLAKSPGTITIAPGDEGGELTNGWQYAGVINIGDLDEWSFTAASGDSLVVRMGSTNGIYPYVRLYGPDGRLLDEDFAQYEGEAAFRATNSGTFTVVASSFYNNGYAGNYILSLAKSPGAITIAPGDEGGVLTNGWKHTGVINIGDLDEWSFTANSGDSLVVRMGNTNGIYPYVRLYGPDGRLLDEDFAQYEGEAAFRATNSGTFTVVASSFYNNGYAGNYILSLAKSPGAITIAPGDEGGVLTNGWKHTGVIDIGDLDEWSFTAASGDNLVVRMGNTNGIYPYVRLYGPDGRLLSDNTTQYQGEATFRATNSGTFTVVASSFYNFGYAGNYILSLAKSPGAITVASGDEGGAMTNGFNHLGTITTGDLDVFSFVACTGDGINLQVTELTGGTGFTPALRLYAPDGALLNTVSGAASAQINRTAPALGTYTLVVGDSAAGAGTYQLTGLGVSTGFILCKPLINGANLVVRAVGGPAGSNYVLFTTTDVATPLANWTPIRTNQFGSFGEFSVTNSYNPGVPQQYFRARTP